MSNIAFFEIKKQIKNWSSNTGTSIDSALMAEELALEKERSEEQSDLRKRLHKPIRQWYKTQPELKAECGRFPIFYQDTATWPHWTKVYKAYIVATEDADVASSAAPPTERR